MYSHYSRLVALGPAHMGCGFGTMLEGREGGQLAASCVATIFLLALSLLATLHISTQYASFLDCRLSIKVGISLAGSVRKASSS